LYLAGPRDNAVLGKEFGGVVVDGVPVFFNIWALDQGEPGRAERFETLITGPRERWLASVDLAEIAARRLKAAGVDATAEREVVRIPGLTHRNSDGVPLDWWIPLYDWYGKDPDPLDLTGYANRGAQAVLIVGLGWIIPGDESTQIKVLVKFVDPVNGDRQGRGGSNRVGIAIHRRLSGGVREHRSTGRGEGFEGDAACSPGISLHPSPFRRCFSPSPAAPSPSRKNAKAGFPGGWDRIASTKRMSPSSSRG
jgi:hypothetical protein